MSQPQHEHYFDKAQNIYYDQDGRVYPAQQVYFSAEEQGLVYDPNYVAPPAPAPAPGYQGGYETSVPPPTYRGGYQVGYETSVPPTYRQPVYAEQPVHDEHAPAAYADPNAVEAKPTPTFYAENLISLRV